MTANVKATIKVGDKTVTFEGPRDFVDEQVARFVGRSESSLLTFKGNSVEQSGALTPHGSAERDFVAAKKPQNHPQTVAVLAFLLAEKGTEEFSEADIRKAYARAAIRPPKVIAQAIRDAKNVYDYLEAGKQRGAYRLTDHGTRTVQFDLPAST